MNAELEWSIRRKIVELQLFLTAGNCTETDGVEIDAKLEQVLEVVSRSKAGGSVCGA
jgi:hypothetical protein